jgi:hypothetical protein
MVQYVAHTKRRGMTKARAARIFLARNGVCVTCGKQIRQGEQWFIEHPEALSLGGSDDDASLWPAHMRCKAEKDAADAAAKAKRDRLVTAGWAGASKGKMQGRGFRKSEPQRRATGPVIRWMDRENGSNS